MSNWSRFFMAKDILIDSLRAEISHLRQQHDANSQRIDRLMEALSRKMGVDLVMPSPPPPPIERVSVPNPWKDPNQVTSNFEEKKQ